MHKHSELISGSPLFNKSTYQALTFDLIYAIIQTTGNEAARLRTFF